MNVPIDFKQFATYSKPGPRYTSYPTAVEFNESYTLNSYLEDLNQDKSPLSLYIHLPFCRNACYFCGCNVIYTSKEENKQLYLQDLQKELSILKDSMDTTKIVHQLHFGGGTPTFFNAKELEKIIYLLKDTFSNFDENAEISCEIDPRFFDKDQMEVLKNGGFNRLSFGIQDFDEKVQKAVHRIQPITQVQKAIELARNFGIPSINFDLIYGLPFQTLQSFKNTIKLAIELDPDRLAIFNYAHVPWLKKTMRKIDETALPTPEEKLKMFKHTITYLQSHAYKIIGMDHFTKEDDELFQSIQKGQLRRNFQGYSTKGGTQTIGIGITSIGEGENYYAQNHKDMDSYRQSLQQGLLPFCKGIKLNQDDKIRKYIIMQLMSNFKLDCTKIEEKFNIHFETYFYEELQNLRSFIEAKLITLKDDKILISPTGSLLIRNIAMVFDSYLKNIGKNQKIFSKTI